MDVKWFENEYTHMQLADGVLLVEYKPKLKITLDVAKKCVADRIVFCEGRSYPMVSVLKDITEPDKEAKQYLSSPEAMSGIKAGAFVVENHLYRLIGSVFIGLYLNFSKDIPPAKLFSNKGNAIDWAKQFC